MAYGFESNYSGFAVLEYLYYTLEGEVRVIRHSFSMCIPFLYIINRIHLFG